MYYIKYTSILFIKTVKNGRKTHKKTLIELFRRGNIFEMSSYHYVTTF